MSEPFSMSFDSQGMSEIAQMYGFSVLLSEELQGTLQAAESPLIQSIQGSMHWQNPSGTLSDSIAVVGESPYELIVGSDVIYAHRRNDGFHGADSLGRVYNDDGAFFMEQGIQQQQSAIMASIEAAAERAWQRLGAM